MANRLKQNKLVVGIIVLVVIAIMMNQGKKESGYSSYGDTLDECNNERDSCIGFNDCSVTSPCVQMDDGLSGGLNKCDFYWLKISNIDYRGNVYTPIRVDKWLFGSYFDGDDQWEKDHANIFGDCVSGEKQSPTYPNCVLSSDCNQDEYCDIIPGDSLTCKLFSECVTKTCSDLGKNCDSHNNGCGGIINCGTCESGDTCESGVCTSEVVCGDGLCDGVETCSSCSSDCGSCTTENQTGDCSCTDWVNIGCVGNTIKKTRTCTPSGCSDEEQFSSDSSCQSTTTSACEFYQTKKDGECKLAIWIYVIGAIVLLLFFLSKKKKM